MSMKKYFFTLLQIAAGILIGIPLLLALAWTVNMDISFAQILITSITIFVLSAIFAPFIKPKTNTASLMTGKKKIIRYVIFWGVILMLFYGINLLA